MPSVYIKLYFESLFPNSYQSVPHTYLALGIKKVFSVCYRTMCYLMHCWHPVEFKAYQLQFPLSYIYQICYDLVLSVVQSCHTSILTKLSNLCIL